MDTASSRVVLKERRVAKAVHSQRAIVSEIAIAYGERFARCDVSRRRNVHVRRRPAVSAHLAVRFAGDGLINRIRARARILAPPPISSRATTPRRAPTRCRRQGSFDIADSVLTNSPRERARDSVSVPANALTSASFRHASTNRNDSGRQLAAYDDADSSAFFSLSVCIISATVSRTVPGSNAAKKSRGPARSANVALLVAHDANGVSTTRAFRPTRAFANSVTLPPPSPAVAAISIARVGSSNVAPDVSRQRRDASARRRRRPHRRARPLPHHQHHLLELLHPSPSLAHRVRGARRLGRAAARRRRGVRLGVPTDFVANRSSRALVRRASRDAKRASHERARGGGAHERPERARRGAGRRVVVCGRGTNERASNRIESKKTCNFS